MKIRSVRVWNLVFRKLSGRSLEEVLRSRKFRRCFREVSETACLSRESRIDADHLYRDLCGLRAIDGYHSTKHRDRGLSAEHRNNVFYLHESALIEVLKLELEASARRVIPRKIRRELRDWRAADLATRFETLDSVNQWLLRAFRGSTWPDGLHGSPKVTDEEFQPLERSLPERAVRAHFEPNCIGKAQLVFACAEMAGARAIGFIPMTEVQSDWNREFSTLINQIWRGLQRRSLQPKSLQRMRESFQVISDTFRRSPDRLHIAATVQLAPHHWMMIDPHQGVYGLVPDQQYPEQMADLLYQLNSIGLREVTVPVAAPQELSQRIRSDLGPLRRAVKKEFALYDRLIAASNDRYSFLETLSQSRRLNEVVAFRGLTAELEGNIHAILRSTNRFPGVIAVQEALAKREASEDANQVDECHRFQNSLAFSAERYLELVLRVIYNQALSLRSSRIVDGEYVHSSGEFGDGWRIAAIAILSHCGIKMDLSDEVESMLCVHSTDRYRLMFRASRPLCENRSARKNERSAETLLRAFPLKSHHVGDLLSCLRDHHHTKERLNGKKAPKQEEAEPTGEDSETSRAPGSQSGEAAGRGSSSRTNRAAAPEGILGA